MGDDDDLPSSLLYVKNGEGGAWWNAAKKYGQIHAGWPDLPAEVLSLTDRESIAAGYRTYYPKGSTHGLNGLLRLRERPSQHMWVTFEEGFLWWCLVRDEAETGDDSDNQRGHFWLTCRRPWSNRSLNGRQAARSLAKRRRLPRSLSDDGKPW
jgi:hypothetical protein